MQELEAEMIVIKEANTLLRAQKQSLLCENHWITKDLKRVIAKEKLTTNKNKVKKRTLKKAALLQNQWYKCLSRKILDARQSNNQPLFDVLMKDLQAGPVDINSDAKHLFEIENMYEKCGKEAYDAVYSA